MSYMYGPDAEMQHRQFIHSARALSLLVRQARSRNMQHPLNQESSQFNLQVTDYTDWIQDSEFRNRLFIHLWGGVGHTQHTHFF